VETVEIQHRDFHRSHQRLEIAKNRDSHIPTAATTTFLLTIQNKI